MRESLLPHLALELDKLKSCIHCGMCLPACPTYRATGSEAESPRGRLYLMKKLLDGELSADAVSPHLDQCLACHGCETVCPSGVQYGRILLGTREDLAKHDKSPLRFLKRLIFRFVLPHHRLLLWGGALLRTYQEKGWRAWLRKSGLLKRFPAMGAREALLPDIPVHQPFETGMTFGDPAGEPVALFVGCVMDVFYNPVHWDTVTVLAANGYCVHVPKQTCCGALAHHAGETDITRTLARRNIDRMLRADPAWIVVNSAGCGSSMKEYDHLLADDPKYADKAKAFTQKVVDVMELLAKKPLVAPKKTIPQHVTYHAACHLYHVQKIKTEPLQVLSGLPGLTLVPLESMETCCGSAGIYNIEYPELSGEILQSKMHHLQQACEMNGADTVVTGNPGCLLQLEKGIRDAGLPMRARHPVSVLANAYREDPS